MTNNILYKAVGGAKAPGVAVLLFILAATSLAEDGQSGQTRYIPAQDAVERRYIAEYPVPLARRETASDIILKLDVIDSVVEAGTPFRVVVRVYDESGRPMPTFDDVVTFECMNGVSPVLSLEKWRHAMLQDTLIILRPGRNLRLTALTSRSSASVHFDVLTEMPSKRTWIEIAEQNLAIHDYDRAIAALKTAGRFDPSPDPDIERKIAGIYMKQGKWNEAEEHFQKALRAAIGSLDFAE